MRSTSLRAALVTGGLTLAATMAQAQTASTGSADASGQPASGEELTEITVTGSRLITNGNEAPTPVTVVTASQLTVTKPTSVFENLSNLPMFSGSQGAVSPPDNAPNGNNAFSALNLRNLGALRALVLFDGHRVPSTSADGLVDIQALPQMLLQRVDVVTGGASAVYGSDAITGVINFVPDLKFTGVKIDLERGISSYNDDASYRLGIAGGTNLFDGRGHIEASFERHNSDGIVWSSQRSWTAPHWTLQGNGQDIPYHLQNNVTIANVSFGGVVLCPGSPVVFGFVCQLDPSDPNYASNPAYVNNGLVGQEFASNGVLTPRVAGTHGSGAGFTYPFLQIGGDGGYHSTSLLDPSRQDQMFGRFDYDVTDNLHAYLTASGAADHDWGYAGTLRSFPPGWNIGACNAFLSQAYQTAFGCTSQNAADPPTFEFSRMYSPQLEGLAQKNEIWVHQFFTMAGLEGKFGTGYSWDANYTHSESTANTRGDTNQNLSHLYAALDAVTGPGGQVVCEVTLTNPSAYPGCVPINVFGPTAPSQAALNYVFGRIETLTTNKLDDVSGDIKGAPFNTWAGPLQMALSAEAKRQSFEMTSNSLPTDFVDCSQLRLGNCVPPDQGGTTQFINSNAARSPVHQTVVEGALEVNVPLLKDLPIVKSLSSNSAVRFAHYSNSSGGDPTAPSSTFSATTWKLGLTWDPIDSLTVRWARSRDFRAPNLYDLYNPLQLIPNQFASDYLVPDPSAAGQPLQVNPVQRLTGNSHLLPEVGYTSTLGFIFHPSADFSVAVDGYDITIINAITQVDGSSQFIQQACLASGGASSLCALQTRPFGCCSNTTVANAMTAYTVEPYNIASQRTWGIDFETNYATRVFAHAVSLRGLLNYQPHLIYNNPAIGPNDQAGASYNPTYGLNPSPVWKASLFAHLAATDRIDVDVGERYRSRLHFSADPTLLAVGGVASVEYTDATVSYTIPHNSEEFAISLNVQNVFNRAPPPDATPGTAIFPGSTPQYALGDDIVGRYWTFGLKARF